MAVGNVGDDYMRRVAQVCETHYARLRHYFMTQLGGAPEADRCARETVYRFFVSAGGRWEEVAEHVPACLMRTAAVLCREQLEERRRLARARKADDESALRRMAEEATRAVQERLRFGQ